MPDIGRLTTRQLALAQAFFRQSPPGFFLTGGAVLVGWELAHRTTDDLDLFTTSSDAMMAGELALRHAAQELGGTVSALTTTPDFRRFLIQFADETLKVDLVRDSTVQHFPKVQRAGVVTDAAEEIFVNKLCTLVERSEVRDLIDVMCLEAKGLRVEAYLARAQMKDAGVTPATLAWLLRTMAIPAALPGGFERATVIAFRDDLERRLLTMSLGAP